MENSFKKPKSMISNTSNSIKNPEENINITPK